MATLATRPDNNHEGVSLNHPLSWTNVLHDVRQFARVKLHAAGYAPPPARIEMTNKNILRYYPYRFLRLTKVLPSSVLALIASITFVCVCAVGIIISGLAFSVTWKNTQVEPHNRWNVEYILSHPTSISTHANRWFIFLLTFLFSFVFFTIHATMLFLVVSSRFIWYFIGDQIQRGQRAPNEPCRRCQHTVLPLINVARGRTGLDPIRNWVPMDERSIGSESSKTSGLRSTSSNGGPAEVESESEKNASVLSNSQTSITPSTGADAGTSSDTKLASRPVRTTTTFVNNDTVGEASIGLQDPRVQPPPSRKVVRTVKEQPAPVTVAPVLARPLNNGPQPQINHYDSSTVHALDAPVHTTATHAHLPQYGSRLPLTPASTPMTSALSLALSHKSQGRQPAINTASKSTTQKTHKYIPVSISQPILVPTLSDKVHLPPPPLQPYNTYVPPQHESRKANDLNVSSTSGLERSRSLLRRPESVSPPMPGGFVHDTIDARKQVKFDIEAGAPVLSV